MDKLEGVQRCFCGETIAQVAAESEQEQLQRYVETISMERDGTERNLPAIAEDRTQNPLKSVLGKF